MKCYMCNGTGRITVNIYKSVGGREDFSHSEQRDCRNCNGGEK